MIKIDSVWIGLIDPIDFLYSFDTPNYKICLPLLEVFVVIDKVF